MVLIKYHKEKVETKKGRITEEEYNNLEKKIKDAGWTNLGWGPCSPDDKEHRWQLYGRPPHYKGECEDYHEIIVLTLADKKDPGKDSGKVLVRKYLEGPIFSGKKGIAWS